MKKLVLANWKTLLGFIILALACLLPSPLNAIDSDVRWCGNYWGGAYVWGFEPENTNDLHDGRTNTVTSRHYVDFTNASAYHANSSWHAYLAIYVDGDRSNPVITRNDWGSLSADPEERAWDDSTLSINVSQFRPGTIGIYGTTRLDCGNNSWFAEEDVYPIYLHGH